MNTTQHIGNSAETAARRYLEERGLRLCDANWRCRMGEIDLVMATDETLIFIEVRYRNSSRFGGGIESIDRTKRRKLIRSATYYLQRNRLLDRPARFDVVAIGPGTDDIEWIPAAFSADDG